MPSSAAVGRVEKAETLQREPREIVTVMFNPNHRLFQIAFKAELSAAALARMWGCLNQMGIRILSASMTSRDGVVGSFDVFLDSADYGITAGALRPKLEALPNVRDIRIAQGADLIANRLFFPLVDSTGRRVMVISKDAFQTMLSALGVEFGSGESVVAYLEGRAIGSSTAATLRSMVPGNPTRFAGELVNIYTATGIGACELLQFNLEPVHIVLQFGENIECKGKHTDRPNSQWLRGHLEGATSVMLDTQMSCREMRCVAKGDQYCVFDLTKSEGC